MEETNVNANPTFEPTGSPSTPTPPQSNPIPNIPGPSYTPTPTPTPEPKKSLSLKTVLLIVFCVLVLGGGGFATYKLLTEKPNPVPPSPEPTPTEPVDVSATDFSLKFLRLENKSENLIYSPLSIKYGLSLLSSGAAGETKAEIDDALEGEALTKYSNIENKLSLANAVFIRDSYSSYVEQSYIDSVKSKYNSEITLDPFASTANIDSWVKNKTFGLIDSAGINVSEGTKMVLANALAIQLNWETQFEGKSTYSDDFEKEDGTKVEATTMSLQGTESSSVSYYKDDTLTVASLDLEPISGANLAFSAFMPTTDKLADFIKGTSVSSLLSTISKSTSASSTKNGVNLYIPKFKFDYSLDFENDLKNLGIKSAFEESADFSAMSNSPDPLHVDQAVHKANIDFSEEGIKAAAITVIATVDGVAPYESEPVEVRINRPFLFVIYDKDTKEIWFTGQVYTPNLWENDASAYKAN